MAKKIKIRVFNTLESNNLMVSGWYSNKDNPNIRYGLFTGATDGLENEQLVYCQKFMKPNAKIPSTNLGLVYIKIRHCNCDLIFEHEYRNWNDDICIGWLRPGNLGGETVNWFFNGKTDCWYYGGNKGEPLVVSHRIICGNITPSDTSTDAGSEEDNGQHIKPDSEENTSTSGGHFVRPVSEEDTSASGGHFVRPGSEEDTPASGGHYVRPGSEENASTPNRLYPTGKGTVLEKYMNEDGSPKSPGRLYPTPLGMGNEEDASTPNRLYPTGKGTVLEKYMNADGSTKPPPGRLYPTPLGMRNEEDDKSEENTEEKDGPHYVRPNSTGK